MENVKNHIETRFDALSGSWVSKTSGYEEGACEALDFTCEKKRYWDCTFEDTYIELKKGKSIWLDEVRYSEVFEGIKNEDCKKKTITLFLIPDTKRTRIETIYILDTQKIIKFMEITSESAAFIVNRSNIVKRSLNMQQSMTLKDLRCIADYEIKVKYD